MGRWAWVLGLVLVVLAAGYLTGSRRNFGPPLDPDSTAPDGAKGLVELIDRLGTPMRLVETTPTPDLDVVVLMDDRLPRDQADQVDAWVRQGGTLVVTDPGSLFTPPIASGQAQGRLTGGCDIPGLTDVAALEVGIGRRYAVGAAASTCFTAGSDAFVVVTPTGDGSVVAIGGPAVFTNDLIDEADNAALAAALFSGDHRSGFLRPTLAGGGDKTLADLIGTPVRAALFQLAVAFGAVVLWRSRRLGHPVSEPQPVQIEGSELTRAVGRLLTNNRHPEHAAAILRDQARRELSPRLGLSLDAAVATVAAVLEARTTLDRSEIHIAIASPVTDDATLITVARLLHRIREETTHGTTRV